MKNLTELKKELERLENIRFMNQMNDHWDADDYATDRELTAKINELKKEIGEENGNV